MNVVKTFETDVVHQMLQVLALVVISVPRTAAPSAVQATTSATDASAMPASAP